MILAGVVVASDDSACELPVGPAMKLIPEPCSFLTIAGSLAGEASSSSSMRVAPARSPAPRVARSAAHKPADEKKGEGGGEPARRRPDPADAERLCRVR